eukprot:281444_1
MNRWATMSSAVTAPCFGPNSNLVACTGSGHIVEFVDNEKGLPKAKVLIQIDGQPNCVSFEDRNEMIICDPSSLALLTTSSDNKTQTSTLCNEYENESFRGPSHSVIHSNGCKFFTDGGPLGDTALQHPKGSVFCINTEGILRPLAYQCLAQPTDLAFSPNEKCLYVAEMLRNRILRFVETNNGLFIYSVFYQFSGGVGPTGIDVDADGNLFVTRFEHKGLNTCGQLTVIDPLGKLVAEMETVAPEVTGVAYDKQSNMVYITEVSTNSIFQIHVDDIFRQNQKTEKQSSRVN